MKRKLNILIAALTALIFASCSLSNTLEQKDKKVKTAYITIDADNARTALPGINSAADFDSFVLTGTTDDTSLSVNQNWSTDNSGTAYSKMTAASLEVTAAKTYNFTLTASKNGALWSGTLQKAIKAGTNNLAFILDYKAPSANGKGNLSIELSVPSKVLEVTAKLYTANEDAIITPEDAELTFTEGKATYTASDIDAGNYVLVYTLWGDAAKTYKLGDWREYAGISKGLTSSSAPVIANNDELESIYTITVDYAGGQLEGASTIPGSYTRYSDDINLPAADRMAKYGHTFAGWKIGSTTVTKIEKGSVGNITVTAEWTPAANLLTAAQVDAMQQSLANAAAGSSITFTPANGLAPLGCTINISKALTVDGNGIEGLTIKVASNVQSNITLKNFKNANLQVVTATQSSSSTSNSSRAVSIHDTENEDGEKIEKFGDDALPLKLEGCEIKEFIVEDEVALYLGTGDEKTTIEELKLDLVEGAEKFTFIENDKDIDEEDKSFIEKLRIEDGLKEINLIGGAFDEVDFADDFSFEDEKLKFNYDPEFEQFKDEEFLEDEDFKDKAEKWDIALAKYEIDESTNGNGVYKFEMTLGDFHKLNDFMGVIFLNDEQAQAASGVSDLSDFLNSATYETPMYSMSIMGAFKIKDALEGQTLLPIYGRNPSYLDFSNAFYGRTYGELVSKVYLENYQIYSKDAAVFNLESDKAILYVNMAAIKKEDVSIHVTPNWEEAAENPEGIYEGGSKLTRVDLTGYKPYFIIDAGVVDDGVRLANTDEQWAFFYDIDTNSEDFNWQDPNPTYGQTAISFIDDCITKTPEQQIFPHNAPIYFPVSSEQKTDLGEPIYFTFAMTETEQDYPDVSRVEVTDWPVSNITYVNVKYYTDDLNYIMESEVVRENLNPVTDYYEYYYDSEFNYKIPRDQDSFAGGLNWNYAFNANEEPEDPDADKRETVIYARPKRSINFVKREWVEDTSSYTETFEQFDTNMGFINFPNLDALSPGFGGPYIFYKSYDYETKTGSNKITSPKELRDWDTVYLVEPYVTLVIADPEDSTNTYEVGTVNVSKLPVEGDIRFYRTAEMNDNDYYTSHTKPQLYESLGTKVYFDMPVNIMYSDCATTKETISYLDFIDLLNDSGNTTKYYWSSSPSPAFTDELTGNTIPAQTVADITFTAENVTEYLDGRFVETYSNFFISSPVVAYTGLFDSNSNSITAYYVKNQTRMNFTLGSGFIITYLERGIATFYSGEEMTADQLLSAADISELVNGDEIYMKYKTFNIYSISTAGQEPSEGINPHVYDYTDLITYYFDENCPITQDALYTDVALTHRLRTVDDVLALEDGTTIYADVTN